MFSILGLPLSDDVPSSIDDVLNGVVLNSNEENGSHNDETTRGRKRERSELGSMYRIVSNSNEEGESSPSENTPRSSEHGHVGNLEGVHSEGDGSSGRLHSLVETDDDGELPDVVGEASCKAKERRKISTRVVEKKERERRTDRPVSEGLECRVVETVQHVKDGPGRETEKRVSGEQRREELA